MELSNQFRFLLQLLPKKNYCRFEKFLYSLGRLGPTNIDQKTMYETSCIHYLEGEKQANICLLIFLCHQDYIKTSSNNLKLSLSYLDFGQIASETILTNPEYKRAGINFAISHDYTKYIGLTYLYQKAEDKSFKICFIFVF